MTNDTDVPLACVPGAIPPDEREAHFARVSRLFTSAVRERRDLPDGQAYRFDAEAFDELARWLTWERRCCPFLHFTLELEPDGGAIWVRLSGPEGTREFVEAEFHARPAA